MRTLLLLCFALLLTSCINRDSGDYAQAVNSWHGGNANQLLKVWGKPYMTITSGGNTVYTYQRSGLLNNNVTYSPSIGVVPRGEGAAIVTENPTVNSPLTQQTIVYCTTSFTANASGKITNISIRGNRCSQNDSLATSLRNPSGE